MALELWAVEPEPDLYPVDRVSKSISRTIRVRSRPRNYIKPVLHDSFAVYTNPPRTVIHLILIVAATYRDTLHTTYNFSIITITPSS